MQQSYVQIAKQLEQQEVDTAVFAIDAWKDLIITVHGSIIALVLETISGFFYTL